MSSTKLDRSVSYLRSERWLCAGALLVLLGSPVALSAVIEDESESVESDGVIVPSTQLPVPASDNSSTRSHQPQTAQPGQHYPGYPTQSVPETRGEDFPSDPNVVQPVQSQNLRQHLDQAVGEAAGIVARGVANEIVRSITQGVAPSGGQPTYQNARRSAGERF